MSLSPMVPNLSSGVTHQRGFWQRPEGKVSMAVLAAAGIGVVFTAPVWIPILLLMMVDTVHIVILGACLAAFGFVVTNESIRNRISLIFKLVMRYLTGMIIQIDPIGILKDRLATMRKRREEMAEQVTNVKGSIGTLTALIAKNNADSQSKMAMAAEAKRRFTTTHDADEASRMKFQAEGNARKAARLERSNVSYQQLLNKMTMIYTMLNKWLANIDFYIDDTSDEVRQQEVQYKALNSAYGAYRKAMSVISGNSEGEELYNTTLEYLADEAGRKLGEIENFQSVAQNFMDTMDLQNASVNDEALAKLDSYEHNLLTSGNSETSFLLQGANTAKKPEATTVENTYGMLFK